MIHNVIIHPKYGQLVDAIHQLKNELSNVVYEFDHLRFHVCENIQMQYMLEFGNLQYQALLEEYNYRRLKRKKELIQAKMNRQESIDLHQIEATLDFEFRYYQYLLDKQLNQWNEAKEREGNKFLSPSDTTLLKVFYRYIMKKIHPDVYPDPDDQIKSLFLDTLNAYDRGDLKTLKRIYTIVRDLVSDDEEFSMEGLQQTQDRLKSSIQDILEAMEVIKSSQPYTYKYVLEDKERCTELKKHYQEEVQHYQKLSQQIDQQLNQLLIQIRPKEVTKWQA